MRKIHTENDLLRLVRHYDDEIEFLIRCNGFSGLYRIYRYRMDRENLAEKPDGFTESGRRRRQAGYAYRQIDRGSDGDDKHVYQFRCFLA